LVTSNASPHRLTLSYVITIKPCGCTIVLIFSLSHTPSLLLSNKCTKFAPSERKTLIVSPRSSVSNLPCHLIPIAKVVSHHVSYHRARASTERTDQQPQRQAAKPHSKKATCSSEAHHAPGSLTEEHNIHPWRGPTAYASTTRPRRSLPNTRTNHRYADGGSRDTGNEREACRMPE
jgi:hypothetical protein